jgi:hypothetical protein
MTIFIDLAASWIVRVSMITVMLGLSVTMNDALYKTAQRSNTNTALASTAEVIYTDLNMAGYNVAWYDDAFLTADSTDLCFSGDLNNGGIPEEIHYKAEYNATTKLYELYRAVNNENSGQPLYLGKNFKSVEFQYYDYLGVRTIYPWEVTSVRIKLAQEIPGATSGFTTALNDFKVFPANL